MTIQFRSRLQSAIDFKDELKSMGVCCQYNSNTQEYSKYETTANECYSNQGILSVVTRTFYPGADIDNFTCEQATERGCCCACKYAQESQNYQDFINDQNLTPIDSGDRCEKTSSDTTIPLYFNVGLKDNVEQCECSRIGGIWTQGSCPTTGDSQTIRNYCYGLDTTNVTEEPDPCKDNPTLPECNEPEDPIGRCCYNCNESGDCTCCRTDLTQSQCTQLDPDSTWQEGGNCVTCVNSDVYGTCTDSTGACYSVYTDGLNPNDTEQTIGSQLCRTGETFKLYGNCAAAAIVGFPVICNDQGNFSVTTQQNCTGTRYGISQYQANYDGDVTQAGPVFANKTCAADSSLCQGEGCIFEIQQDSTSITLSITSYTDGSGTFTCTDVPSDSINCTTTTQNTAFKKYVIKPSDSTSTSCPYTEVPFGVCCSPSFKDCRFVVDESYCCPDCTFRRWDEVVEKLSRTAIPNLENDTLQDQLNKVSNYFNNKYCGNSQVNATCEACDNVCNFIGNACISPCGTDSEINDAGTCQCLQMTYAVYEQQECPTGCTNCAIQNEAGNRCCKRWYGPFDITCEGSAQTNPIYSGIGCDGSEPELLGLCCDTTVGQCYGDNGAQVNQAFCGNDTFLPNATNCSSVNCQPQDPYVEGSCCRNSTCTTVYQKNTGLYDYDLSTDTYTNIPDNEYTTCNRTFNTLPCTDEGSGTNPNICEPLYACCDHFTNSCQNNIPLDECVGPFLQVAKDSSGQPSNECPNCNFDVIDPNCDTLWQTFDKATTTKPDGTPCSTLSGAAANECICSQAVSCKGDGSGCNLVFLDWNTTDGTYTVNSGSSQYYNPDDGDVLLFFYPEGGCAGAALASWAGGNPYYSSATNVSEEKAGYGVCCTFNGLNCLSPDGPQTCNSSCNGSKVTKKYCQNKDGTYTSGSGLYARFIKSNFECKDILVYNADSGTSTSQLRLQKYDCDICAEVANNSYLYPGIELNTNPGTLPKNTKISYCQSCKVANPSTASSQTDIRYRDLFTFNDDANLPFNYNLVKNVGTVYVKTPTATPTASQNRCCQLPGNIYEDDNISWKTTIQQGWNEVRQVGSCGCNGFRNPDCVCNYDCEPDISEQYCPDDFPKRLCCNDQSEECYGILTQYQCSLQPNSKWYENIGDGQAECLPNQCKKGFCCAALGQCPCTGSGGDCLPGDLKLEQECDAGTWRSYPENRCSDNPHPCGEEERGRCCLYNTTDPVNDLRSGISSGPFCLSNITKAQCDGYVNTQYSGEVIQSSIWKKDATCQTLEFVWNASNNNIYTQSGAQPCVNRLCCALDDTTPSPNDLICRGITSNASCAEISGKRTIPNVSDCSITISGNVYPDRCGIGLCCTNTEFNNPGVGTTDELSECKGAAYLEQYYSPAEANSKCDWGACCKFDGTCERVRRIDCTDGTFFYNQVCGQSGVDSPCDLGAACNSGNCSQKQRGALLPGDVFHYNTPCTNPDGVPYCKGGYCCCSTPTVCNNGNQLGCSDNFVVKQDLGNTCPLSRFKQGFTTCTSAGCPEPTGSCCVSGSSGAGSCTDNITASACSQIPNGVWSLGTCANNCKGACCSSTGACTQVAYNQTCSGRYSGNLVPCIVNGVGVCKGACCIQAQQNCLQVYNTSDGKSASQNCSAAAAGSNNSYNDNTTCTESTCSGRCCKPTGCVYENKQDCCANGTCDNGTNFWGGIYLTSAAACPTTGQAAYPCRGACCSTTTCTVIQKNSCSGTFQGYGSKCTDLDADGVADACEGAAGACCLSTGGCSYVLPGNCTGTFNVGKTCSQVTCDPNVLCCDPTTQSCSTKKKSECTANNGQEVTTCNNCSGSCCQGDANGTCTDNVLQSNCTGTGVCGNKIFRYYGNITSTTSPNNCTNSPCPGALGACCSISRTSIPAVATCTNNVKQSDCVTDSLAYRYWNGCGTLCTSVNCNANFGACCKEDGSCQMTTKSICDIDPTAIFNGGKSCDDQPCYQATYFACILNVRETCPGTSGNPTSTSTLLCVDVPSSTPTLDDLGIPPDAEDFGGSGTNWRKQIGTCNGAPIYEYWSVNAPGEGSCQGGAAGGTSNLGLCVTCQEAFGLSYPQTTNCGQGACCIGGVCQDSLIAYECIYAGGTPYPLQNCSTITCPTGFASDLEGSCNYCCGCIDGVVRDCCYRTDENGAQVCSSQINDTSYKGVCNANTAYGSYCDTSLEIPQCVWYDDGSPVYSNRSCSNIGDCIHESVANREIVGSSLRILGSSSKECFVDKRIPRACCYMEYDESNIPLGITCTNVCTQRDCELKSTAVSNQIYIVNTSDGLAYDPSLVKYQTVYTSGALCNKSLLQNSSPHDCGVESAMMLLGGNIGFATRKKRVENVGTCFELIETDSGYDYKCYPTLKGICEQRNGHFVTLYDSDNRMCDSEYAPSNPVLDSNNILVPQTMTEQKFKSFNLSFGDRFMGGYFIGVYKPNQSLVYGSDPIELNSVGFKKSKISTKGSKDFDKGWVLIVSETSNKVRYFDLDTEDDKKLSINSLHDGFYNTYNIQTDSSRLYEKVKYKNKFGFMDFYIPSVEEMKFFASKIYDDSTNYFTYINKMHRDDIENSVFLTSTAFSNELINSIYFDTIDGTNFGRVIPVPAYGSKRWNVRFMRRIKLT